MCASHAPSWEARVQASVLKYNLAERAAFTSLSVNGKSFTSSRIRMPYLRSSFNWAVACWVNPLT